jgi:hypothetical protein
MESKELANVLRNIDADKYKHIIERAALNGYHDHKFDSVVGHPEYAECICPKMQLVEDLTPYPELNNIREDVMNGVYDDKADEQDAAEMRMWLLDDNAGDGMFKALGFEVPTKEERQQHFNKKSLN